MTRPAINVVPSGTAGSADAAEPGSALARIRAAAAAQRQDRHQDIAVGGAFGEHLVIRYGLLPLEDMDRYADLATGKAPRLSALTIDMMVSACRTVLWREDGTDTDLATGLDSGLWELLDWPLPPETTPEELTPREIVLAVFGGNGMAVVEHAEQLMSWMRAPGAGPGESSAATS